MTKIFVRLPFLLALLFLKSFGQVSAQKTMKGTEGNLGQMIRW